ncbi:hypothetical protein OFC63_35895, partial [Escherichia coli]|nr:hypothetical protein [Escherichia coli]
MRRTVYSGKVDIVVTFPHYSDQVYEPVRWPVSGVNRHGAYQRHSVVKYSSRYDTGVLLTITGSFRS